MSNKKQFKKSLNARVKIRPYVLYSRYGKYFDEEWIIDSITDHEFRLVHSLSDIGITLCHDARRSWHDEKSMPDGIMRGTLTLNGKIEINLKDEAKYTPLTQQELILLFQNKVSLRS